MNLSNYCNTFFLRLMTAYAVIQLSKHFALATFAFLLCTDKTPQVTFYSVRYVRMLREVLFFFFFNKNKFPINILYVSYCLPETPKLFH